jgi:hypothetical protein
MNKNLVKYLTILALPLILAIYMVDRLITLFLPWMELHPVQNWVFNASAMQQSVIRVIVCTLIYGLYLIFSSLF